jgi:hypothetical protein
MLVFWCSQSRDLNPHALTGTAGAAPFGWLGGLPGGWILWRDLALLVAPRPSQRILLCQRVFLYRQLRPAWPVHRC